MWSLIDDTLTRLPSMCTTNALTSRGWIESILRFTKLFVHGMETQCAEGMAEWLHARVRSDLQIGDAQGRRYSWGYPACPEQSEHEKVFRLLDAPQIGLRLSGAYALEPEQSTLAIVAHHPQADYFTMRHGTLPTNERQAADEVIKGSDKDPTNDVEPWLGDDEDQGSGDSGGIPTSVVPGSA